MTALDDPVSLAVEVSQRRFDQAGAADFAVLSRDDAVADSLAGTAMTRRAHLL